MEVLTVRLPDAGTAGKALIVLLLLLMVIHVLLLFRVIPYEIVWGGNVKNVSQLYTFEISALAINALFLAIVAIRLDLIGAPRLKRAAGIGMWVIFAYFGMNVIGNLTSGVSWEKMLFAPLSILLALLSLRVATAREAP
jgi:hypothetical protein